MEIININNHNTKNQTLQDFYTDHKGRTKERPWKLKKEKSLHLADVYERTGFARYADRVRECGCQLQFQREIESGKMRIQSAMLCHVRLCPMCNWRRSLKIFHEVSKVMDGCINRESNLRPIFLTLTVKNCNGQDLDETIKHIFKSWKTLTEHRQFRDNIKGWFRALEVTYSEKHSNYHPHIHCILLVDKSYFDKSNKKYIDQPRWQHLWRTSAKLDYDPIVDIRKVKNHKNHKAVAEVAKYTTKDSDYLKPNDQLTDSIVTTLTNALYRKRLYAYGGIMKIIAKELDALTPDEGNLVNIDEDVIRDDVAYAIETYRWTSGASDYIRRR